MKLHFPLAALLLASAAATFAQQAAPAPAPAARGPAAEDARLTQFLDAAFDEQIATNPQQLTQLGSRQLYDRLNDYTDAYRAAAARARGAPARRAAPPLRSGPAEPRRAASPSACSRRRSMDDRDAFRWRWHGFPATNNGSPMGSIPVFLINNHRIDSVADAEAYVARLREVERVMGEIGANMRRQAELGIVPPALQLRAGARGRPPHPRRRALRRRAGQRRSSPTSRPRWTGSTIPQAEKDRLIAAARAALTGPFRRGYETMLATLDAIEPRARRQQRRLEPARRRRLLCAAAAPLDHHRPDRRADPPDRPRPGRAHPSRDGADQGARSASPARSSNSSPTSTQAPEFKYPNTDEGRAGLSRRRPRASSPR